jgi:hypothetical protein
MDKKDGATGREVKLCWKTMADTRLIFYNGEKSV